MNRELGLNILVSIKKKTKLCADYASKYSDKSVPTKPIAKNKNLHFSNSVSNVKFIESLAITPNFATFFRPFRVQLILPRWYSNIVHAQRAKAINTTLRVRVE